MKKAQIRMAETVAVLFIFFLMIGFGFIFYAKVQRTNLDDVRRKNLDLQSIEITQRVSFLPELQCSSKNVITDNCIDVMKVNSIDKLFTQQDLTNIYFDRFGYANITIIQHYPKPGRWTLYENLKPDASSRLTHVPISLFNATSKKYAFGVLEVRYYS
jgi:hypothetical protein